MRLSVIAAAAAGLVAAAPAAAGLVHTTVAKGTYGSGGPARAYLALERSGTRAFAARLRPDDRARVAAVDFRRFAVLAALFSVPTPCHAFRIASVERRRDALLASAVVGEQTAPACIQVVAGAYQVVRLRKARLGADPPRRAVLRLRRT